MAWKQPFYNKCVVAFWFSTISLKILNLNFQPRLEMKLLFFEKKKQFIGSGMFGIRKEREIIQINYNGMSNEKQQINIVV